MCAGNDKDAARFSTEILSMERMREAEVSSEIDFIFVQASTGVSGSELSIELAPSGVRGTDVVPSEEVD